MILQPAFVAVALTALLAAGTTQAQPASEVTAEKIGCFVLVKLSWPQFSHPDTMSKTAEHVGWTHAFESIGTLMDEIYRSGDYQRDPLSFPVRTTRFEHDYAIFNMRQPCVQATTFVRQLLGEYQHRQDKDDAPTITIADRPATRYQFVCGLAATAETCPDADKQFRD